MMKTVVLTGGIGSGKSTVAAYLSGKGIPVYDSDARTKRLYDTDPQLVEEIGTLFGTSFRREDGLFDRKKLADLIFSDYDALQALEAVVYPHVRADFLSWRAAQEAPVVVLESAVILSKPLFYDLMDKVILVEAQENVRLERVMTRDGASAEEVLARMGAQEFDLSKVDLIIRNEGSVEALYAAVDRAFRYLFEEDLLYLQS